MIEKNVSIKDGIKLHLLDSKNYKTDLSVVFITVPLDRNTITNDVLIPEVLKSGCQKYKNQYEISKRLNELYGTTLETGVDKTGKNLVIKIYNESINDEFIPFDNSTNLKDSIDLLFEIVFNPYLINGTFGSDYVNIEKERRKILIETETDDKDTYSYNKAINIMYKNCGFGINKNGYLEDLDSIDSKSLFERYKEILNTGKIDIFISGNIKENEIEEYIKNNNYLKALAAREEKDYLFDIEKESKERKECSIKEEIMDVSQGKLVVGLDIIGKVLSDDRFAYLLYNTILGDGANSKLFRIVREQESLAYTCKSNYIAQKSNIFIRAGIDVDNYEKTLNLINKQLDDMKNGNFTDEDLDNAKRYIYAGIDAIKEEQSTAIIFYYGEEMSLNKITVEEYYEKIKSVTKEQIINLASKVEINTIYFLKNS